jgi:hypothetical protein
VNVNTPGDALRLRAQLEARARGVPHSVCLKITELADCGLDVFEIAAHLGIPRPLVVLVLRGAPVTPNGVTEKPPGVTK